MASTVSRLLSLVVAVLMLAAPLAIEAQQTGKVYRIGVLEIVDVASNAANLGAFRQGLAEFGYVEGQNFVIEYRSADGRTERRTTSFSDRGEAPDHADRPRRIDRRMGPHPPPILGAPEDNPDLDPGFTATP